ncbi:MAG: flagellar hook-associated protein FlgK [bacterium]|nr:flagellar hook-associated protein FlgK [bacterium]
MGIQGLNIGLSALRSSRSAMETIGHNLSNANTEGYSRQSVTLGATSPRSVDGLAIGTGVEPEALTRATDTVLNRRIVVQAAKVTRLESMMVGMNSIESFLGEPNGFGIGGLLDGFFNSVSELSASPTDLALRSEVVRSADSLASQFNQLGVQLDEAKADALRRVDFVVDEINTIVDNIRDLNVEIAQFASQGIAANDLLDRRDEALRALGERINITYYEEPAGVRVLAGGQLLASPVSTSHLEVRRDGNGETFLMAEGGTEPVEVTGGEIGGLMEFARDFVPEFQAEMGSLARSMILETSRLHSTGIPPNGGFRHLTASNQLTDSNGNGGFGDEILGNAGLPFDVHEGQLYVNVVSESTGEFATYAIDVDPDQTVSTFLQDIDEIPLLSASIDGSGRFSIVAGGGVRFDFGRRLDPTPDDAGTFGGGRASVGTGSGEPFALSGGDTLDITGSGGPFTVTFSAIDFDDIGAATAAELAGVLNANANLQTAGMRAEIVGDQVFLQSVAAGATETFDITGGSSLGALGLPTGTASGQNAAVEVAIGGTYTGDENGTLTFRPIGDGAVGTTPGLQVEVVDETGTTVATIDVGEGYAPGTAIQLADGLTVSFTFGELSATNNDAFVQSHVANSDTSDILAAFGLNSFFTGSDAASFGVRGDLVDDPFLIASSGSGAKAGNQALLEILALQQDEVEGLDASFMDFYGNSIGRVGFEIDSVQNAVDVEQFLADSLTARKEQVSGVNVDEELVNLIQFEQSFTAASRFIQTINSITDEVMSLI